MFLIVAIFMTFTTPAATNDDQCRAALVTEAITAGIDPNTAATLLAGRWSDPKVIQLDRFQPETELSFESYLKRLHTTKRILRAREEMVSRRQALTKIEWVYHVEPELLVALWGIETDFGRVLGHFDVINSLFTLACDQRRSAFFTRELLMILQLLDHKQIEPNPLRGSWAGAMGQLQFLPSVLLQYGVDKDNNGNFDVFRPGSDSFATGANFLAGSGWRHGEPWGYELRVTLGTPEPSPKGVILTPAVWHAMGLQTLDGVLIPRFTRNARIVRPDHNSGRRFIVFPNYEALLIWNRSTKFALTVALLMDQLRSP